PKRRDAADAEAAALPPAGVRLQREIDTREITRLDDAVPADADGVQPLDQRAANPEDAGAFGPEQPLVPVGGEKIDRRPLHVERIDAESLDRVDEEENAPLAAKVAQRIEIIAKTAGELDEAEAQDARVRVHGGAEVVDQEPALAARHTPHLDAAIFQVQPR